jgi:glycosyltransferase involved in cell wall biosynthesis
VTPRESALKGWLARRALRSCDALTGDSTDILLEAHRLGAVCERAFRVLWGVDFSRFQPDPEARGRRREFGFTQEDVVFFSPRSFTQPYYNIDTVIAAAARVRQQHAAARFLFAGYEGDPEPFRRKAAKAGLEPVMQFVGRLPHDRFALALQCSDVFLSVPSVDATAVSLLEAMACGCAIVVSDLPSATEWISDELSGLVVRPRDTEALARAMARLASDSALRERLGAEAVTVARRHAGFQDNMSCVQRIFTRLVEGTGGWPAEVALQRLVRAGEGGAL